MCGVNRATNCLYDPYSTTFDMTTGEYRRTPFSTPVVPPECIDPLAAFYLSSYPDPNFVDPLANCGITCNNYIGTVGSSRTTHNISIIDICINNATT